MDLFKLSEINEVISKEDFLLYITCLMKNRHKYSREDLVIFLEILGDKYCKFYDESILTSIDLSNLSEILVSLTDFSNAEITENLIGILFDFSINDYYYYLKSNVDRIDLVDIKKDVLDALSEYEIYLT